MDSHIKDKEEFVSVIIPVYNDWERLFLCLEALGRQSYPKELFEVIVVDNGSKNGVGEIHSYSDLNVIVCVEETPGSYAARNKGVSLARGAILAFTDSDCIPEVDWIREGVEKFLQTPNCGLVGGRIELFSKNPLSPTAVEVYDRIEMGFPQDIILEHQKYAFTANAFTSIEVIKNIGVFDGNLKSGGDREWGRRIFNAGYKQVFASQACVKHPSRSSFIELYKRVTRISGGTFDAERGDFTLQSYLKGFGKDVLLLVTPPFRSLFRIWKDERLHSNTQRLQFTAVMLFVRYASACERIRLRLGGVSRRW